MLIANTWPRVSLSGVHVSIWSRIKLLCWCCSGRHPSSQTLTIIHGAAAHHHQCYFLKHQVFLPETHLVTHTDSWGQGKLTSVVSMRPISTWLLKRGGWCIHTDIHTMLLGRGRSHLKSKKQNYSEMATEEHSPHPPSARECAFRWLRIAI